MIEQKKVLVGKICAPTHSFLDPTENSNGMKYCNENYLPPSMAYWDSGASAEVGWSGLWVAITNGFLLKGNLGAHAESLLGRKFLKRVWRRLATFLRRGPN